MSTPPPGRWHPSTAPVPDDAPLCAVHIRPGPPVVAAVTGELDREAAPLLLACIAGQLHRPGTTVLVVDLSEVTFLDAEGLRVVAEAESRCRQRGIDLRLRVGHRHTVVRALTITGLIAHAEDEG
ncbi:MAG: anti-sigma-factor antagonist [Klenkia sp.]|nr:anti-sigma-factor antagonist [Klenkia sp.]